MSLPKVNPNYQFAVSFDDIKDAETRLAHAAVVTPLVENPDLNALTGGRILLKLENFQRTGSFKFRGAYTRLSQFSDVEKRRGVVAFSTGNHAQAVACAASMLDIPATIAMPSDTPAVKVEKTRNFGADVVFFDRNAEDGTDVGQRIAHEKSAVFVPPFNDAGVIAGQGTCGLEIVRQAKELGVEKIDDVLVSSAGGGFISGCALAFHTLSPATRIHSVEAIGWDAIRRSLLGDHLEDNSKGPATICDAILATRPGEIPYSIFKQLLSEGYAITDREAAAAVAYAFNTLKVVAEPGGAAALGAVLAGKIETRDKVLVVAVCSGNIELDRFNKILGDLT